MLKQGVCGRYIQSHEDDFVDIYILFVSIINLID